MRTLVLVSRDPAWALELATAWAAAGDDVVAVLFDHGAVWAREGHPRGGELAAAADAGVTLRVHDEALTVRGIGVGQLAGGVKPCDLDEVADLLTDGVDKAVWL